MFVQIKFLLQLLGGACFSHGPYTFYKAVRVGNGRVLRLGSFFLTKLWSDADLVSIGELQLLWMDSRGPNQPLASLRLYFLPENTPDGRRDTHGEVSPFNFYLARLAAASASNYYLRARDARLSSTTPSSSTLAQRHLATRHENR